MEPFLQGNKDGNEESHLADKEPDAELYHRDHRVCRLVSFLIVAVDFVFAGLSKLLVTAVG